jgi:hypothetical protein
MLLLLNSFLFLDTPFAKIIYAFHTPLTAPSIIAGKWFPVQGQRPFGAGWEIEPHLEFVCGFFATYGAFRKT